MSDNVLPDPGDDKDYCLFCGIIYDLDDLYATWINPKRKKGLIGNTCTECKATYLDKPMVKNNPELAMAIKMNVAVWNRNTSLLKDELKSVHVKRFEARMEKIKRLVKKK